MLPTFTPKSVNTHVANALELFNSEVGLVGRHLIGLDKLDLPFSNIATVKFTEKISPAGDREILKDPIRKKCDTLYRESKKNIIWVETTGQVDFKNTFLVTGQVRLRRLEPYESPSGLLPKWVSIGNSIQIPCLAALAKTMAPGSEFELQGEGRLNLKFEAEAEIQATGKKNISLLIQKLPQENRVMVKLSTSKGLEGSLGYKCSYDPAWSFGAIGKYILEKLDFLKWSHPASSIFEAKRQDNNRIFKQYILDLSQPEQAKAYEELFRHFPTKEPSIAEEQEGESHETSYDINAFFALGETQLTLLKVSEIEKVSRLNQIKYQESKSIREYLSKWFSKMSVIWEWISLDDPIKKINRSYCHLTFDSPYASDFFDITDSLHIPVLKEAREILETYPKTDFHADIFFKDAGIKNIQQSSFDQGLEAYLGEKPPELAKRYGEIQNKWFFTRWYFLRERSRLEAQDPWLYAHRQEITQAYLFAQKTQPFKGSLNRFSDMKSIVSLMKLAGLQEAIIHELSIIGPGMGLYNKDEGMISHPEQEITEQWAASV